MRSTIEIENKSSLKVITMKKKRCEKKDTVSETISFVIKGRLMTNKGGRSKKMVSQKKLEQTKIERKAIEKRNQTKPKTIKNKRVSNEEEVIKKKSNAEAIEKPSKPIKKNIKTSPPKQVVKVPVKKNKETPVKKKLVVDGKPKEKKKQEAPKLIKKTKVNPPKPSANMENKKAIVTKKKSVQALKTKIEAKTQQLKKKTNKPKQPVQKKQEEATSSPNIDSSTSDELTLDLLRKNDIKPVVSMEEAKQPKKKKLVMKTPAKGRVGKLKQKLIEEPKKRKAKLVNFGPKRHRVASLNALAKVHCLYENETRSILDTLDVTPEGLLEDSPENYLSSEEKEVFPRRNLRTVPGLRAVGKHWDFDDMTSSSDENSDGSESARRKERDEDDDKRCGKNRRKRNRTEIIMDLKDMVVRKRMASLNATAILAASYCVEKRAVRSPKSEDESESGKKVVGADGMVKAEDDKGMIEVCATPNKKVAVILNQDTDVTITGVYVNSTTRSTHHEGYCSIAGMQYRISATSHTQTAATAVASECFNSPTAAAASSQGSVKSDSSPSKSYTPLDALSSMQPPGGDGSAASQQQVVPTVPGQRSSSETSDRHHGCSSAFTAPPSIPYGSPSRSKHPQVVHAEQNFVHGYYQPAGPLITVPHGHIQPQLIKGTPISDIVSTSPLSTGVVHPPAPSSTGDSSDNEVIITSVTAAKDSLPPPPQPQPPLSYRFGQYHGSPHHAAAYSYSYPPQYYAVAPPPAPPYSHHDMCYSPATQYLHHKYPPPSSYRRYLPSTQYYQHAAPELYGTSTVATQQTQQVTTSNTTVEANTFRPPQNPPTIMEPFPPPSSTTLVEPYPPHYYPAVQYGPIPPPSCFTHSAPSRTIPYINTAAYQTCPCPMQSCPKNVLTGPLTGDSKRSSLSKEAVPLPPVASLALPLEPASATGPPSPARGSAGMPPPPSPAGATYRSGMTPKLEATDECKPRKARVGKNAVRNQQQQNTMLLMCQATTANTEGIVGRVKREVESPKEVVQEVAKKDAVSQETQAYNTVITTTTTTSTTTTTTPCQNCTQPEKLETVNSSEVQSVKNEQTVTGNDKVDVEGVVVKNEEPEPCQKTVAETVKVKNMKRKLLEKDNEQKEGNEDCPQKKAKVEKVTGSYKNLIKKNPTVIRINNGKQKLESPPKRVQKSKRLLLKQKLSPTRTDSIARRLPKQQQQTKPLSSNNAHLNLKATKTEVICKEEVENVEPTSKGCKKTVKCDERTKGGCVQGRVEKDKCKKCRFQRKNGKVTCKVEPIAGKPKKGTKKTDVTLAQAIAKVQRRSFQSPRWSNGWIWEGEAYEAKVFINSDETTLVRRCYPRMRHREGDIIEPGDCVLLKAGQKKNELPFVAKIAALWENPDDGEMMLSLLWYYRPEHTEQGRLPIDQPDEVFASRHKDSNSVACIEDKCYVLTYNEYCRYRKELRRLQEGVQDTPRIPIPEPYPRKQRQPPSPLLTPTDLVFYCRKVYDFRQKRMVKNPTHIYQLYQ